MHAERPNVRPRLAADPKHSEMPVIVEFVQFALVDSSDAELALHRGNQGGSLE